MAGYIGSKSSVTLVDGYTEAEADAEFVNDPNDVITVSGSNVGIGTSSPVAPLDVTRSGNGTIAVLQTTGSHGFEISAPSSTTLQIASKQGSKNLDLWANTLSFSAGGSERMRLDSSGKVGIGTSSPSEHLEIANEISATPSALSLFSDDSSISGTQEIGVIYGKGKDSGSSARYTGAKISYAADGTWDTGTNYYYPTALKFYTQDASATDTIAAGPRMTIDSSGNVGIGTSPSYKLDVKRTDASGAYAYLGASSDGGIRGLSFTSSDNGVYLGAVHTIDATSSGGQIVLSTGNAEAMRIDSSGKILINRTSTAEDCKMNINHGSSWGLILDGDGSGTDNHIMFSRSGSTRGYITSSSSSVSYNTSSDYRLKENVVDLTGASARVNQLNPSRFNFIADDTDTVVDGFLAHEVATVVPEAITGAKDEVKVWKDSEELPDGVSVGDNKLDDDGNTIPVYQGIDQSKLVPLLTAALQEALTEIASLKTRVEALEA